MKLVTSIAGTIAKLSLPLCIAGPLGGSGEAGVEHCGDYRCALSHHLCIAGPVGGSGEAGDEHSGDHRYSHHLN